VSRVPLSRCAPALLALFVAGCVVTPPAPPAPAARYEPVAWTALSGWRTDRVQQAWPALRVGCRALVASAATRNTWLAPCSAAEAIDADDERAVRAFFETNLIPYRVLADDGADRGLVTGYYEPLLDGSRTQTERFGVPLYAPPDDLVAVDLASLHPELAGKRLRGRVEGRRVVPYWTRAEIERGQRPNADKAIVYVADPLDAFLLEVQGSGRIRLPDGSAMRLGYADQNGHPYRAIGRALVERGELSLPEATLAGIRDWVRRNPQALRALLDENPSYVFFREVPTFAAGSLEAAIDGPIGSLGVPLAAGRAIAVDPRSIPLGAPVFIATTYPTSDRPLERLVLAQDTGGAIRGAVRADFYWGSGEDAAREAGRMREQGRLFLLWPKDAPPPKPAAAMPGKPD
jgi:membrane-bound lytic murein transglycosylase A